MLHYIRANAQSWGVKAAFGIIILVFVFWGIGNMRNSGPSGVLATVNGQPLLMYDFANSYRRAEENIRLRNPGLTSEQLIQLGLKQQVLQQMVADELLRQEAQRAGVVVTPVELRQLIERIPVFHNEAGKFDPEVYKRVLKAQKTSPGRYEEQVRRDLLDRKLRENVTAGAFISEDEARGLFNFTREKRVISYVPFALADYMDKVSPGEDEIKAAYESNRASYTVPAKVAVEYILINPTELGDPANVKPEAVAAWYEKNKSVRFEEPERVKVRHILITLAPDAPEPDVQKATKKIDEISAALKKGAKFSDLAVKESQDAGSAPKGGELGWITRGETVPPFEEAAFSLAPGKISEPVRSQFGLHLIQVEEKKAATVKPLAEVEPEIRKILATEDASGRIRDVLDNAIEANIVGRPMAEIAKSVNLKVMETSPLSAADLVKELGINEKGAATLLAVPAGRSLDTALEAKDNGFIIARVKESQPAKTRDFDEVKSEVAAKLKREMAVKEAMSAAASTLKEMKDGALPDNLKSRLKDNITVDKSEPVPGLGDQFEVSQAIFAGKVGSWLPSAFSVDNSDFSGAVIVRLDKSVLPSESEWKAVSAQLMTSLAERRREEFFQIFLTSLGSKAKIELKDPNFLQEAGGI